MPIKEEQMMDIWNYKRMSMYSVVKKALDHLFIHFDTWAHVSFKSQNNKSNTLLRKRAITLGVNGDVLQVK